jgi:hypothetical protein
VSEDSHRSVRLASVIAKIILFGSQLTQPLA